MEVTYRRGPCLTGSYHRRYPTCGTGMAYMYNVSFPAGTVYTVQLGLDRIVASCDRTYTS
jgi:hypothetical protein